MINRELQNLSPCSIPTVRFKEKKRKKSKSFKMLIQRIVKIYLTISMKLKKKSFCFPRSFRGALNGSHQWKSTDKRMLVIWVLQSEKVVPELSGLMSMKLILMILKKMSITSKLVNSSSPIWHSTMTIDKKKENWLTYK